MKSVGEFKQLTPKERARNVKSYARKSMDSKKLLTKVLIAGEEIGDFGRGKGEMAAYAKSVTAYPESIDGETGVVTPAFEGIDLRRDVQGTYEACNVLRGIRDPKACESVIVPFAPLPNSKIGELSARFDVVLGFTPPG